MQANEGRSGYNLEATTQLVGANITASHSTYDEFSEEDKNLVSSNSINANKNFGFMSANVSAEKNEYQSKDNEAVFRGTASTRLAGIQLTNSYERILSDNSAQEESSGDLAILTNLHDWRLRGDLRYDLERGVEDKFRNFNISAFKKISRESTLRFNSIYNFSDNTTTANLRYSKQFKNYALDVNLGGINKRFLFWWCYFPYRSATESSGKIQISQCAQWWARLYRFARLS